jgi:hypothetical protein
VVKSFVRKGEEPEDEPFVWDEEVDGELPNWALPVPDPVPYKPSVFEAFTQTQPLNCYSSPEPVIPKRKRKGQDDSQLSLFDI